MASIHFRDHHSTYRDTYTEDSGRGSEEYGNRSDDQSPRQTDRYSRRDRILPKDLILEADETESKTTSFVVPKGSFAAHLQSKLDAEKMEEAASEGSLVVEETDEVIFTDRLEERKRSFANNLVNESPQAGGEEKYRQEIPTNTRSPERSKLFIF